MVLAEKLDFEASSYHSVVIQAVDDGFPRSSASAVIRIDVTDANDAPHHIRLSDYIVMEHVDDPRSGSSTTEVGSTISDIVVHDQDEPSVEELTVTAATIGALYNRRCFRVDQQTDSTG